MTEVHLGSTVDEQIRWVAQAWHAARQAQRAGVPCVAFTLWALLGSHYWNRLVTSAKGHYEPGVFDITSGAPVATELAAVIAQLASGQEPHHPALASPGWWERDDRICLGCEEEPESLAA
jgi:dTDP-4-dehydrorhamnose reductase